MPIDRFSVHVPATSANLGPGFDCLGLALNIYNDITLVKSPEASISITGEGANNLPRDEQNRVYQAIATFYQKLNEPMPSISLSCHNEIPLRRGLGSSAAAVVGGLVAANLFCHQPLSKQQLLQLAVRLEGHPDNVAPALLGGCQIVVQEEDDITTASVPLPSDLKAVLFIPDLEMPTDESRRLLPPLVSREDAVYNIGRAALLSLALSTGQVQYLRQATQDRLHQPARQDLFPAMSAIFAAALEAGALGVFLSGGGSTILALTLDKGEAIAQAMTEAARGAGVAGRTRIAKPSPVGAHVIGNG
ncbi:MAG: homoserine kinase [Chloroflexi bacterium]|nr:homoserine kinase [Chloroflexota bacterium]